MSYFLLLLLCGFGLGDAAICGTLEARPSVVPVHSEARLYFTHNVPPNSPRIFSLQHKTTGGQYTFVDKTLYETATSSQRPLAVFNIHRSEYSNTGIYRVYCSASSYSTETQLIIKDFPPSPPAFADTVDVYGCKQCLPAWSGQRLTLTCSTWNGTQPVAMEIRKNNIQLASLSTMFYPALRELRGIVTVMLSPGDGDHLAEVMCLVKNGATSHTLFTSTQIYIKRLPSHPVIGTTRYTEGEPAQVTCSSSGGRPPPIMHFQYGGREYHTETTKVSIKEAFYVNTSLALTLKRSDNVNYITCCSNVSKDIKLQCSHSKLSVNFPPLVVYLRWIHEAARGLGLTMVVLECRVGEAFPSSGVVWDGLEGISHNISDISLRQGRYGSVETYQAVSILLSPSDNKREITCSARNKQFPDARPQSTYILNVTYAPVITIDPGDDVTVPAGDDVSIICSVDGNPPSFISWYGETGLIEQVYEGDTISRSLKLYLHDVNTNTSSTFTCHAYNGVGSVRRNVSVTVIDPAKSGSGKMAGQSTGQGSAGEVAAVIVCLLLLVVIVTIIVVVVFRRRRVKQEVRLNADVLQIRVEERQPSLNPQLEEPVYNNISNMKQLDEDLTEQSPGSKHEQNRQHEQGKDTHPELIYAELELSRGPSQCRKVVTLPPETERFQGVVIPNDLVEKYRKDYMYVKGNAHCSQVFTSPSNGTRVHSVHDYL